MVVAKNTELVTALQKVLNKLKYSGRRIHQYNGEDDLREVSMVKFILNVVVHCIDIYMPSTIGSNLERK